MNRSERIKTILTQQLQPIYLHLQDDSAKHAGHAGSKPEGETHYSIEIESQNFIGLSRVQRHQLVYKLLEPEFKAGLHALGLKTYAPGER